MDTAALFDSTNCLIFLTIVVYLIHLYINKLAAKGKHGDKWFPNTVSDISRSFELEMTPAKKTFAIWGIIFLLQLSWMIYCVSTIFRTDPSAKILTNRFFIGFIVNIVLVTSWLFTWARKEGVVSFLILLVSQICLVVTIGFAMEDLAEFLDKNEKFQDGSNQDVWIQRWLVQNALLFYATWTTVATLINFAIVLSYYMGLTTKKASIISLTILGGLASAWFFYENFTDFKYPICSFTPYIVLMIASAGIWVNIGEIDQVVGGISFLLLILSGLFLVFRCISLNTGKLYFY